MFNMKAVISQIVPEIKINSKIHFKKSNYLFKLTVSNSAVL